MTRERLARRIRAESQLHGHFVLLDGFVHGLELVTQALDAPDAAEGEGAGAQIGLGERGEFF